MTLASARSHTERMHVVQGEHAVSNRADVVMTTLLGSCIAACIFDADAGVGGMNHFLLPGDVSDSSDSNRYGVNAMELLINDLLQRGAQRYRLKAKLFGGSAMNEGLSSGIGEKNAEFAKQFLSNENIEIIGASTGGSQARRIEFWPSTGRARQSLLDRNNEVFAAERQITKPKVDAGGDLELF